jgi:hypothetical protein
VSSGSATARAVDSSIPKLSEPRALAAQAAREAVWSDAEAEFYAEGMARSNYVERVGSTLRERVGTAASLLDVGAGDGSLGAVLLQPGLRWVAVEPNAALRRRLALNAARAGAQLTLIDGLWHSAAAWNTRACDVVLCANIPGLVDSPRALFASIAPFARRTIAWIVPAQAGPRTFCLSGCLPAELHGSDETPGVEIALGQLGDDLAPTERTTIAWEFRYPFADLAAAIDHFRDRLAVTPGTVPDRRLQSSLEQRLEWRDGVAWAHAPKVSALLVWHIGQDGGAP